MRKRDLRVLSLRELIQMLDATTFNQNGDALLEAQFEANNIAVDKDVKEEVKTEAEEKEEKMKLIKPETGEKQKSHKDDVQEKEKELTVTLNNSGKSSHHSDAEATRKQPREEISLQMVASNKPEVFSPLCISHPLRIEEILFMAEMTSKQEGFISFISLFKIRKSRRKGGDARC